MARNSYPYTIDNGAGERLTFLRRVQGPHGERLEVENTVTPGAGPVQRVVFPIQIALGRLLGKYGRYADAPEPVRR